MTVPEGTARPRGRPPGSKTRAPLEGRRPRDAEVIETAVRLFSEKGYAATSIQDVAAAMGLLKGSLYYYIDSKESLLRKIFEDSHEEVQEIAERHRTGDAPAVERLRAFLTGYALWYLTHLQRASLYAREWRYASDELRDVMAKQRKYYDDVLRGFLDELKAAGELDTDLDPKLATYFVMSAVSSLPDWFNPNSRQSAKSVASAYAEMALKLLLDA
jgi:AcrR family transcriptional regulator